MNRRRARLILILLVIASTCSVLFSLAVGSVALTPVEVWAALFGQSENEGHNLAREVVRNLRLPRALSAFACGGLLALAGALMQVLLRNPLADPYVLGISGGAAVGALAAMLLGVGASFGLGAAAFAGALIAMGLVFGLARGDGSWTQTRLLLTGVIVASGCGAAVALMLTLAPDQQLRGMLFWLMGDAGEATAPMPAVLILAAGLAIALASATAPARISFFIGRNLDAGYSD